jgi:hypothetical protein
MKQYNFLFSQFFPCVGLVIEKQYLSTAVLLLGNLMYSYRHINLSNKG